MPRFDLHAGNDLRLFSELQVDYSGAEWVAQRPEWMRIAGTSISTTWALQRERRLTTADQRRSFAILRA
jgi:hypothetical protein